MRRITVLLNTDINTKANGSTQKNKWTELYHSHSWVLTTPVFIHPIYTQHAHTASDLFYW